MLARARSGRPDGQCNRERPPMGQFAGHRQGCNGAVRAHQRAGRPVRLANPIRSKAKQRGWAARPVGSPATSRVGRLEGWSSALRRNRIPLTSQLTVTIAPDLDLLFLRSRLLSPLCTSCAQSAPRLASIGLPPVRIFKGLPGEAKGARDRPHALLQTADEVFRAAHDLRFVRCRFDDRISGRRDARDWLDRRLALGDRARGSTARRSVA